MKAPEITDEQFIQAMQDVVQGNEDYVYESPRASGYCVYFDEKGNPSCLIGHALAKCDVEPFDQDRLLQDNAYYVLPQYGISAKVAKAAQMAQQAQDCGETWQEALARFDGAMGYTTNG